MKLKSITFRTPGALGGSKSTYSYEASDSLRLELSPSATEHGGCRSCSHDRWEGGYRVCDRRPYACKTAEQVSIVRWLGTIRDPFRTTGCPSYTDYRLAEADR